MALPLHPTRCAICGTLDDSTEVYPARLVDEVATPAIYSARRLPDRLHHRIVRCETCGLYRSDPRLADDLARQLYAESTFTYGDETDALRATYGRYLRRLRRHGAAGGELLEIGCGNGFFLAEARAQGYAVRGVEPSADAIARAAAEVRGAIVQDVMRPGLFEAGTFDVVVLFHVLDHLPDPAATVRECLRVLKPGGLVMSLNHDAESVSARLLRARSPIVDIEHTYLFSKRTMRALFEAAGFRVEEVGGVTNAYALPYLVRLLPLAADRKQRGVRAIERLGGRRIRLRVRLGNLFLVGRKPVARAPGPDG